MARARQIEGLDCERSFGEGAAKIVRTRFEEVMAFEASVLAPQSPDRGVAAVHDMRVASRRLRAALEAFVDVFPKKRHRQILKSVKGLADALGEVRDLDVMVKRLQRQKALTGGERRALATITTDLESQQGEARKRLEMTLHDLNQTDLSSRFEALVAKGVS